MASRPGRRSAVAAAAFLVPAALLSVLFLPWWAGALAAAACAGAAAAWVALSGDARFEAHARAVRRWADGDDAARPPLDDALGVELSRLRESVSRAVGAWTREEAQLSAIMEQMTECVVAVDAAGLVVLINPALSRLLGVAPDHARGRPYLETLRHDGIARLIGAVLRDGRAVAQEVRVFAPEELVFDAHAAPLLEDGRASGAMLVLHDITRLRRLEQMRRDFVANVGHELRTPLASIKGFAETLREGALDDKDHRVEFVSTIEEHADRLSKLVDDLLDLSAIESGHRAPKLERTELGPICEEVARQLAPMAEAGGVTLTVADMESLPRAKADRDQLRQILTNLVANAIKYNERGGSVTISAEPWRGGLRTTVRDTGVGIPADDLPRVFERFYRVDKARSRDAGGTGLGLSIVKHLVEAHGGEVSVESSRPGGSAFRFTLPAA